MQHSNINPQLAVWSVFAAFTGIVLAVNAVQALSGHAALAWWHYPTLGVSLIFVWAELPDCRRARVLARTRRWRRQAAKRILPTLRTARGLAVLNDDSVIRPRREPPTAVRRNRSISV